MADECIASCEIPRNNRDGRSYVHCVQERHDKRCIIHTIKNLLHSHHISACDFSAAAEDSSNMVRPACDFSMK
jgi:hypothetical protein